MELPNQKLRLRTAFTTYNSSAQSSADEEVSILDRAVVNEVPFHLTPQVPVFGQLEVLQSSHCAFSILLNYRYYCLVNPRLERQKHEGYQALGIIKGLETSMATFGRAGLITILQFLSRFVEECDVKRDSEAQACLMFSSFVTNKAFDDFLATRNDFPYTRLRY